MVKRAAIKDFFREIKKTFSRFVSIILLVMLAVAFLSGLRSTKPDMLFTADKYFDDMNLYDIKLISNLGLTSDDVSAISKLDGVGTAEGAYQFDALVSSGDEEVVITISSLSEKGINGVEVIDGRLPTSSDECVVAGQFLVVMNLSIGDQFSIGETQEVFSDALPSNKLTIVGVIRSPLYISNAVRESSSLGSGSIVSYVMVDESAIHMDYYTSVYIAVENAEKELTSSDAYDDLVSQITENIASITDLREEIRYQEIVQEAEDILDGYRADLANAQKSIDEAKKTAEESLAAAWAEIVDGETQIRSGYQDLTSAENRLSTEKSSGYEQINQAYAALAASQTDLDTAWAEYEESKGEYDARQEEWNSLSDAEKLLMPQIADEIEETRKLLEKTWQQLTAAQTEIDQKYDEVDGNLEALKQEVAAAQRVIDDGYLELHKAEAALTDAKAEYQKGKDEAEAEIADGEKEIANAQAEIKDGEQEIAAIERCNWYVFNRGDNGGYSSYQQDSDRMGAIANLFPMIFFLVAMLVCLTTMTRMVEEKRIEIGTYKALGYNNVTTTGKFIGYSFLAAAFGIVSGFIFGMNFMPRFIFNAYSIMYDLPKLETPIYPDYIILSAGAALLCTVGATVFACAATLRETPASLLRARAPKPGKRVLLERVAPVWKRMSFFGKVSARNIFRFKKRLLMTVIGIGGCTALIVTGFGLRDSIVDITSTQFGDIFKYDIQAYLVADATQDQILELHSTLDSDEHVADYMFVRSDSYEIKSATGSSEALCFVPENFDDLSRIVSLRHRGDDTEVLLGNDGVIITEKLAEMLNVEKGDTVTIESDAIYTVKISDITENYIYNYVYMSPSLYEEIFEKEPTANQVLMISSDASAETKEMVSSALLKMDAVRYVPDYSAIVKNFDESMNSINSVVLIILAGAALLAFVVLFNLMNINMTERTRELATIKVLGFYDGEVTRYVIRENTVLTIIGIVLGLIGGKYMHSWLVRTVEIDMVMFIRDIKPLSYVLAAILTLLFAAIVNLIGHYRMKRINMVESLKTNE